MYNQDDIRCYEILEKLCKGRKLYGEVLIEINNFERKNIDDLCKDFKIQISSYDTFIDSYFNTLRRVNSFINSNRINPRELFLFILHQAVFRRLRASYILCVKGYFEESIALWRTLSENILILTAINKNIISEQDYFKLSNYKHRKGINKRIIQTLIDQNGNLTADDKKSLNANLRIQHRAVHQSSLYFESRLKNNIPVFSILPITEKTDKNLIEISLNQFLWFMYLINRSLLFLSTLNLDQFKDCKEDHKLLDELFFLMLKDHPSPVSKAIIKFANFMEIFP